MFGQNRKKPFAGSKAALAVWLLWLWIVMLSGCTAAPPQSAGEEIVRYHWIPETAEGGLDFAEHQLYLSVRQGSNQVNLKGEYFMVADTLTVLSEDYGTVVMTYELVNHQLKLTYFGQEAVFVKADNFTDENA